MRSSLKPFRNKFVDDEDLVASINVTWITALRWQSERHRSWSLQDAVIAHRNGRHTPSWCAIATFRRCDRKRRSKLTWSSLRFVGCKRSETLWRDIHHDELHQREQQQQPPSWWILIRVSNHDACFPIRSWPPERETFVRQVWFIHHGTARGANCC